MRYVRGFERIRRRRRLLAAMGYAIAIACAWLIGVSVVARIHALPSWVPLLAVGAAILPLAAIWKFFSRVNPIAAAAGIEKREPRFEERLETVVSQHLTPPRLRASDELLQKLTEDVQQVLTVRSPSSLVSLRPMLRAVVCALVASVALLAFTSHEKPKRVAALVTTLPVKAEAVVVPATSPAPPTLVETRIELKNPAYLAKSPTTSTAESIDAPVGSELIVNIVADKAVDDATLETEGAVVATTQRSANTRAATIPVTKDALYRIKLGATTVPARQLKITAIPDRPPTLTIIQPRGESTAAVGETCEIAFETGDDFGVAGMTADVIISSAANGRTRAFRLPVDAVSPFKLALPALRARVGDIVTIAMQARDAAGQISPPQTMKIVVTTRSCPLVATIPLTDLREAVAASQALTKTLELIAPQLEPNAARTALGRALAAADEASAGLRAASLRLATTSTVGAGLHDAAQSLADDVRDMRERLGAAGAPDAEKPKLAELLKISQQLNQTLTIITRGTVASMLDAQMRPRELAAKALARRDIPAAMTATHVATARAPSLVPLAAELTLDPAAADFSQKLSQVIAQGDQVARATVPPDAFDLARQWLGAVAEHPQEARRIERRLSALARVESMRRNANPNRAADIRLLADAAARVRAKVPPATAPANLSSFADAINALQELYRPPPFGPPDQPERIVARVDASRKFLMSANDVKVAVQPGQPTAPASASQPTQPAHPEQVPPNYREAIAAYFQALARDAAAAPAPVPPK